MRDEIKEYPDIFDTSELDEQCKTEGYFPRDKNGEPIKKVALGKIINYWLGGKEEKKIDNLAIKE